MTNKISETNTILAIVTYKKNKDYIAGGAPIFFVNNKKELEERSMLIARITLGMVHDIGDSIKVIISH